MNEINVGDRITDDRLTGMVLAVLHYRNGGLYGYTVETEDGETKIVLASDNPRKVEPTEAWRDEVAKWLNRFAEQLESDNPTGAAFALDQILPGSPTSSAAERLAGRIIKAAAKCTSADLLSREQVKTALETIAAATSRSARIEALDDILPDSPTYTSAINLLDALGLDDEGHSQEWVRRSVVLDVLNRVAAADSPEAGARRLDTILPVSRNYEAARSLFETLCSWHRRGTAPAPTVDPGDFVRLDNNRTAIVQQVLGSIAEVITSAGVRRRCALSHLTLIAKATPESE